MSDKIRIAINRAATCDGCDMAILDIDDLLLKLFEVADIAFGPTYMDAKYEDVEKMPDGYLTATLVHGAMRDEENVHMVKLLRQKSQLIIAYGACSSFGGIPSLANAVKGGMPSIWNTVYNTTDSTTNPDKVHPEYEWVSPKGNKLTLPKAMDKVLRMDDYIHVDYYLPGCPPSVETTSTLIKAVYAHVKEGAPLPPNGTILASEKTLCDECNRTKPDIYNIKKIHRPHLVDLDPDKCFLEQGVICMGIATRAGCGAQCTNIGNMPCRGCYGPTGKVLDQGASMLSALASVMDMTDHELEMTDDELDKIVNQVDDPLGTFYRYSFSSALINERVEEEEE
ncbi:MAG TPA: oxidoreductase [Caldisericia bacterium]|nr:oxidoreductase [Caldisericia bacterium]HPF49360.1 oxidoreductase [Caldisericia bacterium]HPI84436.1 oxidoreductase [Caldisericia bacterium]HPQ93803.1 oxidoreductase [Caldisericia bacterium]HRV75633.1 oxidoreductase [Caldisericia bacterium]